MNNKIVGYIVTARSYGEPLELCYPRYSDDTIPKGGVLLRSNVTMFNSRKLAKVAIKRTARWARDNNVSKDTQKARQADKWDDPDNYDIWTVRGTKNEPQ